MKSVPTFSCVVRFGIVNMTDAARRYRIVKVASKCIGVRQYPREDLALTKERILVLSATSHVLVMVSSSNVHLTDNTRCFLLGRIYEQSFVPTAFFSAIRRPLKIMVEAHIKP